jgi:uncharacterized metal-binding protein
MSDETPLSCSRCGAVWQKCGTTNCWSGDPATRPPKPGYCPSEREAQVIEDSFRKYTGSDDDARLARVAAQVEGLCYQPVPGSDAVNARWTRVEDTIALAKLMGWKKIGIGTCVGLLDESERLSAILQGPRDGTAFRLLQGRQHRQAGAGNRGKVHKVRPGTFEPACNPIAQAELLNKAGTDMNIIVGLCVGHDMLFAKYSQAPVTTLVVKDRVTGHNPVAVLYGQNFYYKRLQKQQVVVPEGETPA